MFKNEIQTNIYSENNNGDNVHDNDSANDNNDNKWPTHPGY